MSLHIFQSLPFTRALLWRAAAPRATATVQHIASYIRPGETILDVGAGICDITLLLQQAGHPTTPLDIEDYSCTPAVRPVLYNGTTMPFRDKSFDVATILTVLHHTPNPEQVLREAARVARRIIIIEDVYTSTPHKYATFFMDSLLNVEFVGHPHTNRTDAAWHQTFKRLGLKVAAEESMKSFIVMRHKLYVLEAS